MARHQLELGRQTKTPKLQIRTAKADRRGKARSLQRILTRPFCAQGLAIKKVTENKGKMLGVKETLAYSNGESQSGQLSKARGI